MTANRRERRATRQWVQHGGSPAKWMHLMFDRIDRWVRARLEGRIEVPPVPWDIISGRVMEDVEREA